MLSSTLRLNFCYLKIIHILHPRYHPKITGHILKNDQKEQLCLCLWDFTIMIYGDFIIMIIMKMKMKIKNRSHRYEINRPSSRHGCKYSKYKKCLSMMILMCTKQHLSKIWSSIHGKVKQHWGLALDMDANIVNIKSVSVWWYLYVLSNT